MLEWIIMRKYWYSCCERYRPTNACQTNKNSKEQENPLKHKLVLRISNQNSSRTLPWIGRTSNFDHFVQSLVLIKIRGVLPQIDQALCSFYWRVVAPKWEPTSRGLGRGNASAANSCVSTWDTSHPRDFSVIFFCFM